MSERTFIQKCLGFRKNHCSIVTFSLAEKSTPEVPMYKREDTHVVTVTQPAWLPFINYTNTSSSSSDISAKDPEDIMFIFYNLRCPERLQALEEALDKAVNDGLFTLEQVAQARAREEAIHSFS